MTARGRFIATLARVYAQMAPTGRGGFHVARLARALTPARDHRARFSISPGLQFDLDLTTYPDVAMAYGLYELDTARVIRRLLKPGGHFVDVGANLGYFTLLAARCVGATGHVDAFEPDEVNRARLMAHVDLNDVGALVTIHPLAASDHAGTVAWHRPTDKGANHGMASTFSTGVEEVTTRVACDRVDAHVAGSSVLIKVDVEGAELLAIKGMTRLLQQDQAPTLIIEHNPESARMAGFSPGDLYQTLLADQPRYRFYWIGRTLQPLGSAEHLESINKQGNILVKIG